MNSARNGGAIRRGQPVGALCLILVGWVAVRAMLWDAPVAPPDAALFVLAGQAAPAQPVRPAMVAPSTPSPAAALSVWSDFAQLPHYSRTLLAPRLARARLDPLRSELAQPAAAAMPLPDRTAVLPQRLAAGHNLLLMAAFSQLPLPPELHAAARSAVRTTSPRQNRPLSAVPLRWSADSWLLWRRGGGSGTSGFAPATYGGSQTGLVIRYRLAPVSPRKPVLYLRATSALQRPRDETLAAGLALRPVPRLPVVAAAELRATRMASGTRLRPAVALITELPPVALPLGARGEAYAQAGYVGGTAATGFVDAQLRLDRPVLALGSVQLRAGAGAWGGAQDGAGRIDLGPSASLGFKLGATNARLSADWRFRVAGRAAPDSGPALTLSAGF